MDTSICYVGLFDKNKNEIKGNGYKRVKITKWKFDVINQAFVTDSIAQFPTALRKWGVVVYAAIFDKNRTGERLTIFELHKKRLIEKGDKPRFAKEDLFWRVY